MRKRKECSVAAYCRVATTAQLADRPRVIGYCRVARDDRQALENQRLHLLEYCEEKGYDVVHIICETVSGARERNILRRLFRRPKQKGLIQIQRAARKHNADGAVATTVSRLTRNTASLVGFVKTLDASGFFVETKQEGRLSEVLSALALLV
jgi:DNA invertase Pin-like site-specific DNA recombinase